MNFKTEFLFLEENYLEKLIEVLGKYNGQKALFVTDTESQKLIRQNLKKFQCEIVFYKKESRENSSETLVNDTLSQFVDKNNIRSYLCETTIIVCIGSDNEINIAKQISHEFKVPYVTVLNSKNSSFCYSEFFVQNFEIKKGFLPIGIIVNLYDSSALNWYQKLCVESAKCNTLKCCCFFDELFLGKQNFYLNKIDESLLVLNTKITNDNLKVVAEKFCDLALLQQREKIYHSLFLLTQIYQTIAKKNSLNNEFVLYKTLIKVYEIFTNSFLVKYKCFKYYDLALNKTNKEVINSSYIKYVLTNFDDLINKTINEYYNAILTIEEELNNISYVNMYKDKISMCSEEIIKALKIFSKIQNSPTYLNIIDFYNLF